jgi:hypothetical protein
MTLVSTDVTVELAVTLALALPRTRSGCPEMFPDAREMKRRANAFEELPWAIPTVVLMHLTDEDLDALAVADDEHYWRTLNAIVRRIAGGDDG